MLVDDLIKYAVSFCQEIVLTGFEEEQFFCCILKRKIVSVGFFLWESVIVLFNCCISKKKNYASVRVVCYLVSSIL